MNSYTDFAYVYDTFMDEVPYEKWAGFISRLIKKYGISRPAETSKASANDETLKEIRKGTRAQKDSDIIVELGCGTGSLTRLMYQKGYDIIGIDNSEDMLSVAYNKKLEDNQDIMYLCQDMRKLKLGTSVGTFISVCDSVNYILTDKDMVKMFSCVRKILCDNGVFIFDFNTVHKYRDVIGDTTIAENREDCSFIWENFFDKKKNINEYDLTIFVRKAYEGMDTSSDEGLFRKSFETHLQRGYTLDEMKSFIESAGLFYVTAIDADTHKEVTTLSERIYVIARKCYREVEQKR